MFTFYFKITNETKSLYYQPMMNIINSLDPLPEIIETQFDEHIGIKLNYVNEKQHLEFITKLYDSQIASFTLTSGY
jgi:hypothetical protein